jgi:hypothetical protein
MSDFYLETRSTCMQEKVTKKSFNFVEKKEKSEMPERKKCWAYGVLLVVLEFFGMLV